MKFGELGWTGGVAESARGHGRGRRLPNPARCLWTAIGCLILISHEILVAQPQRPRSSAPRDTAGASSGPAHQGTTNGLSSAIEEFAAPPSIVEADKKPGFHQGTAFGCDRPEFDPYGNPVNSAAAIDPLTRLRFCASSFYPLDSQKPAAPQKNDASSVTRGSPGHIFWLVPAFHVAYQKNFTPLARREKFDEWLRGTYDSRGLGLYALESATLEHSSRDGFCGYGAGWGGYGKCFGSVELDANISSFFGDFLFPVVMHQDPRYFRLGEGSLGARMWYAVSRVFVTHSDSGRTVFYSSALAGSVLAAAASNLYYPRQDRGFGSSLNRFGLDLGDTALFNVAAEFWPDIKQKLSNIF